MERGMKVEVGGGGGCTWLYLTHRSTVMSTETVHGFGVPPVSVLKWEENKNGEMRDYSRKQQN